MRTLLAWTLVLLTVLATAQTTLAIGTVLQQNYEAGASTNFYIDYTNMRAKGYEITANSTYTMTKFAFSVAAFPNGTPDCNALISIWNGDGTKPTSYLAPFGTIANTSLVASGWNNVTNSSGYTFTSGSTYWVVVEADSACPSKYFYVQTNNALSGLTEFASENGALAWSGVSTSRGWYRTFSDPGTTYTVHVNDAFDLSNLANANVSLYNTTSYVTSALTNSSGDVTYTASSIVPASLSYNVSKTNYTTATGGTVAANTTATTNLSQAAGFLTLEGVTTGQSVTFFNVSVQGGRNYTDATSGTALQLHPGIMNLTITSQGWFPTTATATVLPGDAITFNATAANTHITYRGSRTGIILTPTGCTQDSIPLTNASSTDIDSIGTITCPTTSSYTGTTNTIYWYGATTNTTSVNLTEYALSLNFDANVTGTVTWTNGTDLLQNVTYYNVTSYQYLRLLSTFPLGTTVRIMFNNQTNDTLRQYYEFIDTGTTSPTETMKVEPTLDWVIWLDVRSTGMDSIEGALVRVYTYTDALGNGKLLDQRLTTFAGGNAYPGTPIAMNQHTTYWLSITKDGFQPYGIILMKGADTINDMTFTVYLRPTQTHAANTTYLFSTPKLFNNESGITLFLADTGRRTVYYNTSDHPALTAAPSGGLALLTAGVDYHYNDNITIYAYLWDTASASYVSAANLTIPWSGGALSTQHEPSSELSTDATVKKVLTGLLLAALIVIASITSFYLKNDAGQDFGFYLFLGGSVLLAAWYTPFLGVALVSGLTFIGSILTSTTRT